MTEETNSMTPLENVPDSSTLPETAEHAEKPENVENQHVENAKPVAASEEQFLESETPVLTDESHEEEEVETAEDYSTYSREDLVALLETYVNEVEVPRFKARIAAIREFLNHAFVSENESALNRFIEEGGIKDDFAPVPDSLEQRFLQAIKRFNKKRIEYNEKQEKQRVENLTAKNEILTLLKDLIQNEDNMNKAFERFHELQAKWRAIGPVPSANVKDLQLTYKFLIDKFYDFIKINRELQDLDQRRNLETKISICEQADQLLFETSLNTAFRKLYQLQDKWRETGPVPRDKKNETWDRFKATCDKLFEQRKDFIAEADEKRGKNLEAKTQLCEAAEGFKWDEAWKHKEWQDATIKVNEFQTEWKKIGPADKKVNDEIWNRFKTACDAFYKAKNDFYHKRKQELAANLQMKTELCIQAEALQNSQDWKMTTAELIRLQQEWKKTGQVIEKQSEKIWKRFRTACDAFFHNKTEHFSSQDKVHDVNLVLKLELIEAIENYVAGVDSHISFEELKSFQRKWSEIGMVPLNKKDEIFKKFKTAIDAQFDKLKMNSGDRQKMKYHERPENNRHAEAPRKMDDDRRHLMNKITELKSEVQLWENNIGFFAKSKNADKLKSEFEEKISKAKEEIKSLKDKLDMVKE
ncbi:MAG: DUF349 domain-containing protein [Bacteroidetes bacterium]|nr:DUF349 domain-containing protein [Bacteroidota bacterium]